MADAIPENFPGNSYNAKSKAVKPTRTDVPPEEQEADKKPEQDQIVAEAGRKRKKSGWQKLKASLVSDDNRSVGSYLLLDVIVPNVRDLIFDIITQGASRSLYGGESRHAPRGGRSRRNDTSYTSYDRMYREDVRRPNREMSRRGRENHEFDEVEFPSRLDADVVVDALVENIKKYGETTVADLYSLAGITPDAIDSRWGWDDLRQARVHRARNGMYVLDMPPTLELGR